MFPKDIRDIQKMVDESARFERRVIPDINPQSGTSKARRPIWSPTDQMRRIHDSFLELLRGIKIDLPNATGAMPGESPLTNLERHRLPDGGFPQHFFVLDLTAAYRNVNIDTLASIVSDLLIEDYDTVREFLDRCCVSPEGGLYVGSPSSPDLFNLYCEVRLDRQLRALCQRYDVTYSRYLDDLLFSSEERIGGRKRRVLRREARRADFTLNDIKSRVYDLTKGAVNINGIGITREGRMFHPRNETRGLLGLLNRAMTARDVDPSFVHGKAGAFLALTNKKRPNSVERKVIHKLDQWRKRERRRRRS